MIVLTRPPSEPELIAGRYQLRRVLGEGSESAFT